MTEAQQTTPSGQVIAFPPARRVDRIRAAARLIYEADDCEIADDCRFMIAGDLFRELEAIGIEEFTQDEAVGAFFSAVEEEMLRLEWNDAATIAEEALEL